MFKSVQRLVCIAALAGGLLQGGSTAVAQSATAQADVSHQGFASALQNETLFVIGGLIGFEGNTQRLTDNYKINLATGQTTSSSTSREN